MAILTLNGHDLGEAPLFCPSKIYSALYVHPDFRTKKQSGKSHFLLSTLHKYIMVC